MKNVEKQGQWVILQNLLHWIYQQKSVEEDFVNKILVFCKQEKLWLLQFSNPRMIIERHLYQQKVVICCIPSAGGIIDAFFQYERRLITIHWGKIEGNDNELTVIFNRTIYRKAEIYWATISCDLTSSRLFLWRWVKDEVNHSNPHTVSVVTEWNINAFEH